MEPKAPIEYQKFVDVALSYQNQALAAQAELEQALVTGRSHDGIVTLLVGGTGKVKAVQVDPRVLEQADVARLQEAIKEAIEAAGANAGKLAEQKLGAVDISLY